MLTIKVNGQSATLDAVGQLFAERATELHVDLADIPFAQSFVRQSVGQLQTQLCLVGNGEGVGQIGGVAGIIVIVAVIAHQHANTAALAVERRHAEG